MGWEEWGECEHEGESTGGMMMLARRDGRDERDDPKGSQGGLWEWMDCMDG